MAKVITPDVKEAIVGEYIEDKDLLDRPIKLRIVASELEIFTSNEGKEMKRVIFHFEDNKGEQKQISSLSFAGLARQMDAVDPDIGDILQLETIEVKGEKYLVWKVDIVKPIGKDVPAKNIEKKAKEEDGFEEDIPKDTTGPVKKDSDDEEIKLEDIPF